DPPKVGEEALLKAHLYKMGNSRPLWHPRHGVGARRPRPGSDYALEGACSRTGAAATGWAVGMLRLANRAISAIRAITDSDERSASIRALAFSLTTSSVVALGTPALSSAAR